MANIDRWRDKISTTKIVKATHLLTTATLTVWMTISATAFDEGVVKGKNVNVRAQANHNSEVVTQVHKGDRLVIIDEVAAKNPGPKSPKSWYMIALPSGTLVWVSAKYIEAGKVSASRLNVRSGPGEKFSVLGRINNGTAVSELRRDGEWAEIEAPEAVHGYIATFLVDVARSAPEPVSLTPVSAVEPASATEPPSVPVIPEPIPVPTTVEVVEIGTTAPAPVAVAPLTSVETTTATVAGVPITDPNTVVTETTVAVTAPPQPEVKPNALLTAPDEPVVAEEEAVTYRVINPDAPKKTMLGRWWQRVFTKKKQSAPQPADGGEGKFHEPPAPEEGPPAVRNVTREGIVVRSWNIQAPSDYALKEVYTGRVVNYLWTTHTNIPWKDLRGRTVRVTGEEAIDRRWKRTPVLRIETLKTIDDDGEG